MLSQYVDAEVSYEFDNFKPVIAAVTGITLSMMAGNDFLCSLQTGAFTGSTMFLTGFLSRELETNIPRVYTTAPRYIIESAINAALTAGMTLLDSNNRLIPSPSFIPNGFDNRVANNVLIGGAAGLATNYAVDVLVVDYVMFVIEKEQQNIYNTPRSYFDSFINSYIKGF
jgi:hypothetical protein